VCSASRFGRLYPGKDPVPVVQEAGWAAEPVWIGAENLAPPGFDTRTFQLVASRYTDRAIPAPFTVKYELKILIFRALNLCFKSRAVAQAVSLGPLAAEARFRSQVSPSKICGGQSGTGTGFPQSTSVSLCHYYSINAP
jgi:hypothetical protein